MNYLGLFGKYWREGAVKTRLARAVGGHHASQLYRVFLATLTRRFARAGERRWLVYTPAINEPEFLTLARSHWELVPQSSGDLGDRMQAFFQRSIDAGAQRVVVLGSDSPTLPVDYVQEAFARLQSYPVVLVPSTDGGYCLLGVAGSVPPIFHDMAWSQPTVLEQTLARLSRLGIRHWCLPTWYDIDELNDLQQLDKELHGYATLPDEFRALGAAVRRALAPL